MVGERRTGGRKWRVLCLVLFGSIFANEAIRGVDFFEWALGNDVCREIDRRNGDGVHNGGCTIGSWAFLSLS